jgi:nucleoside-diphosphate-sugar epimerase
MNKNSKILVVGASGMVGSAIIRKLLSMGYTNILGTYHSHMPDGTIFIARQQDPADLAQGIKTGKIGFDRPGSR